MSDTFIAMSSIRSTYFSGLCDKIQKGNASELEVIDAIKDLCNDNERLAVLSRRKAAEIANTRAPVSMQEAAKVLLAQKYDDMVPAFIEAQSVRTDVVETIIEVYLRAIAEGGEA